MKTPITWLELLKEKITELKKTSGKPVSIGDVAGEAKKDWVAIKAGKHPKYSQGKAKSFTLKHKKSPKHHHNENKNNEHNEKGEEDAIMRKIMHECPKCMKKFNKLMKKNKTKKNKKHYKGGENDEDEDISTDIVLSGGSDGNAVEDEIIKENTITTTTEAEPAAEVDAEPAAEVEEKAAGQATAAKQAGGKKKRKSNKRK